MTNQSYNPDQLDPEDGEWARLAARARKGKRGFIGRMKALGLRPGMRILDLGCGEGLFTVRLASYSRSGEVLGIDFSERFMARAKQRADRLSLPHLRYIQGSAEALPLESGSLDWVYARVLFQHLSDPIIVLDEIHRVLAPGGILVIEDVDHGMVFLHPAPEHWPAVQRGWWEGQRAVGGDPFLGRKLPAYLREHPWAQFEVIPTTVHGRGDMVRDFAGNLGLSMLDYVTDPALREKGEALLRELASPPRADETDLWMTSFLVRAQKA